MVTTTTSDESDGYFGVRWDSPTPKPLQNLSLASFRTLIPWPVCTKRSTTSCFWGRKLCKVTELRMSIHWRVGMFYVFPIWWEYVLHTEVVSYPKQDVWNWYVDLCPCHFSGGRIGKATTKHAQVATGFFLLIFSKTLLWVCHWGRAWLTIKLWVPTVGKTRSHVKPPPWAHD